MVVDVPEGRINERFDIVIERNNEDPEVGGYFAYRRNDVQMIGWKYRDQVTRGHGDTPLDAIVCLCCCLADGEEEWVHKRTTGYV